ncbi:MAG: hypothetical protein QXI58_01175 [Candidatus Micrarchaeia archaeon]
MSIISQRIRKIIASMVGHANKWIIGVGNVRKTVFKGMDDICQHVIEVADVVVYREGYLGFVWNKYLPVLKSYLQLTHIIVYKYPDKSHNGSYLTTINTPTDIKAFKKEEIIKISQELYKQMSPIVLLLKVSSPDKNINIIRTQIRKILKKHFTNDLPLTLVKPPKYIQ